MTQFTIPVTQYHSAKPGAAIALPPQPFGVNERQLVIAMVRATLTANSGRASRKYMAAIVWPTLRFLLDWTRAPNLCVSSAFHDFVRDFSFTGRIGELAQGVSFAYWKWQRGYSWITDFGPWAEKLTPPYSGKKSPDFVMFNPSLSPSGIALMEAKGTQLANHVAPMGRALRQCKAALPHVPALCGFGSVLTLDSKTLTGSGALHIRDPENIAEASEEMRYYLFRRSYASWFDLVGDEARAAKCREWFQSQANTNGSAQSEDGEGRNPNSSLRVVTCAAIGFDPNRTSFEIDSEVDAAITDINAFRQINWGRLAQRMQSEISLEQKLLRFPDGTLIVER